jgi:phytol kinase
LLAISVVYILILSFLFISLYLNRKIGISSELIRDITHILGGLWIFFLISIDVVLIIGIPIIITLIIVQVFNLQGIKDLYTDKDERFYGLILYSISLISIPILSWERKEIAIAAILILSLGDGIASLIGKRYGKNRFRNPFSKIKSVEGSLSMLILSIPSAIIPLIYFGNNNIIPAIIAAFFATLIEALSPPHLDNIIVPFSVLGILSLSL